MLPNFLVLGAQRSGTTYLYGLLRQHPEVFLPENKELHFFDQASTLSGEFSIEEYSKHFECAKEEVAIGEVTPSYMYLGGVPELIINQLGEIRLIFLLRNPIDRAYSHYWFQVSEGREYLSFKRSLEKEPCRLSRGCYDRLLFSYVDRGFYMEQINRFLSLFPRDKMLFLISEDFFATPHESLCEVCRFLGVAESFRFDVAVCRNRRLLPKYTFLYRQLLYAAQAFPCRRGGCLVSELSKQWLALIPKVESHYPPMSTGNRHWLQAVFDANNQALAKFLNRELSHWR